MKKYEAGTGGRTLVEEVVEEEGLEFGLLVVGGSDVAEEDGL